MPSRNVGDATKEDGVVAEYGLLASGSSPSFALADSVGIGHADILLVRLAGLASSALVQVVAAEADAGTDLESTDRGYIGCAGRERAGWVDENEDGGSRAEEGAGAGVDMAEGPGDSDGAAWEGISDGWFGAVATGAVWEAMLPAT